MTKGKFAIVLLFLIGSASAARAQKFGYTNYSVNDGLASSTVYCVEEDHLGRMWFGTQYGVSVFNGNRFENIERKDGLKETEVFLIFIDSKERAWFINMSNDLYYSQNGIVKKAKHKGLTELELKGLSHIRKIFEDANGTIWLLGKGVYSISGDSLYQRSYDNGVTCFDLRIVNGQYQSLSKFGWQPFVNECQQPIRDLWKMGLFRGSCKFNNRYLAFIRNEITEMEPTDTGNMVVRNRRIMNSPVNRIKFIDNRYLWILTLHDGAYCIDIVTNDTINYLQGKAVSDIHIDKEKNIWMTTLNEGVFRIPNSGIKIFDNTNGLSNSAALSIAGNEYSVWVGTAQGSIYKLTNENLSEFQLIPKSINSRILNLDVDVHNNIYAASDNSLYKLSADGKSEPIKTVARSFKCVRVYDSLLLCGTSSELRTIKNGVDITLIGKYDKRVTSVCRYNNHNYAVGTLEGLFFTDLHSPLIRKENFQLEEKINYISSDVNGNLWVATHNDGVYMFDGASRRQFATAEGLLSNSCKHVFCNKEDSTVWISTNKGVSQIVFNSNSTNFNVYSYTTAEGLPTDDVNQVFVRNDTLWAATSEGIVIMPVTRQFTKLPLILISGIIAGGKSYSTDSVMEFSHASNTVEINFECISISGGNKIRYKYRLSNLEKNWVISTQNNVRYVGLEPGIYNFEVFVIHPKGMQSKRSAMVTFTILPPYWKTWWFYGLEMLAAASIIYIVFKVRLRKIRTEEKNKSRLLQSEITSLRAQMNPHFIFNSLNSIQDFIFNNEKENANEYLTTFSGLMRLVLENSSRNFISIEKECQFLNLYLKLEQLRMNHKFMYEIIIDESITAEMDEIPSMILQPIVENSLLHGILPKKSLCNLTVRFTIQDSKICCYVLDNGVGISDLSDREKVTHKSFGLTAINERIKLLNSLQSRLITFRLTNLTDEENNNVGTEALLTVSQKKPTI